MRTSTEVIASLPNLMIYDNAVHSELMNHLWKEVITPVNKTSTTERNRQ